ncbi:MAG: LCP family protein [Roseburia sp.]|nr:LCP family protein [Roseburia sp.]
MKTRKRKKNKIGRIAAAVLSAVLILVLSVGLAVVILYKSGEMELKAAASTTAPVIERSAQETQQQKKALESIVQWQDDWVAYEGKVYEYNENTINILLLGIDQSGRLSGETDLSDWSAGQADTIFLVSLNQGQKSVSIIGIPRNSMVSVDIYNEEKECIDTIYNQICLQYGYAGGGELGLMKMKDCVSELMYQLPIHGVCAISFNAISIMTDMLDGIEVTIPDDMTELNASYSQGARVTLTGKNVVNYLRYRNYNQLGSPTTRLTRQKDFMQAAISKGIAKLKSNPMFVSDVYQAIVPYMNTDITLDRAVYLGAEAIDYRITADSFYQLTGEDKQVDFTTKTGSQDFYDDYYLDDDALQKMVMEVFYHEVVLDTTTHTP